MPEYRVEIMTLALGRVACVFEDLGDALEYIRERLKRKAEGEATLKIVNA